MIEESYLIEAIAKLMENRKSIESETLNHINWIVNNVITKVVKKELTLVELNLTATSKLLADNFINAKRHEDLLVCIRMMSELSDQNTCLIPVMATQEVISKLCDLLQSSENEAATEATVKCLSTMFASPDHSIIEIALIKGVLKSFNYVLGDAPKSIVNLALFGLSNIAAGTKSQSRAILHEN